LASRVVTAPVLGDPTTGSELLEQRLVELAGRSVVDTFDGGADMAQPRCSHTGLEALGAAGWLWRELALAVR
jgi:hypothetical protein